MASYTFRVYNISGNINTTFTVVGSFVITVNDPDDNNGIGDDSPPTETGLPPRITALGAGAPADWSIGDTFFFSGYRGLNGNRSPDVLLPRVDGNWSFSSIVQHPDATTFLTVGQTYTRTGTGNFKEEIVPTTVPCFTKGTGIATKAGIVLVEDLAVGDQILTMDSGYKPVKWIGTRILPAMGKAAPICFSKGSIGNDEELIVSPQHRVLLRSVQAELCFGESEVLVPAKHLVNGDTIYRKPGGMVHYYHLLFDCHEIVFSNGVPTESFHPGQMVLDSMEAESRDELFHIFPELRLSHHAYGETARRALTSSETRAIRWH